MATVDVINLENKKVGTIDLDDSVFAAKVNIPLVHQVVKAQLASRRQGTACTKTRSEVRGGGKKPFKQKGTGNARQGSSRSPLQVGGGRNFGPRPRSYEQRVPQKMIEGALRSVLSDRAKEKRVLVVDGFKLDAPKTKVVDQFLRNRLKVEKVLVIDEPNLNLERSGKNLRDVRVLRVEGLNVYDILRHEWVLMTKSAVQAVNQRLSEKAGGNE